MRRAPYQLEDFIGYVPDAIDVKAGFKTRDPLAATRPRQTWQEQKSIAMMYVALADADQKRRQRGRKR